MAINWALIAIVGGVAFGAGLLVSYYSPDIFPALAREDEDDFFVINTGENLLRDQRMCIAAHCPICYEYHNPSVCSECIERHCRSYLDQVT